MNFSEKLQLLRKSKGFTQEAFASHLNVSRQAVAKWEAGQAYPDIANLIQISNLLHISVDYLVKEQACAMTVSSKTNGDLAEMIRFRLEASRNTYAACMNDAPATRLDSHDFHYENGAISITTPMSAANSLPEKRPSGRMDRPYTP